MPAAMTPEKVGVLRKKIESATPEEREKRIRAIREQTKKPTSADAAAPAGENPSKP